MLSVFRGLERGADEDMLAHDYKENTDTFANVCVDWTDASFPLSCPEV